MREPASWGARAAAARFVRVRCNEGTFHPPEAFLLERPFRVDRCWTRRNADLTAEADLRLEDPKTRRRPRKHQASRPGRRRFGVRRVGVLMVVLLLWLAWSIGGALTAPGTDPTSARLAEWARVHGPGWGVRDLVPAQAQPSLPGEGAWQSLVSLHGQPAIRAAFLRPDSQHTSYLVGVTWLNQNLVKMVLHPGYQVPGTSGLSETSQVSAAQRDSLLATFNSGFTMVDANGGYWQDGQTMAPLRQGAASMVLYKNGHMDVVSWNAANPGPDVAAVRQNLVLLVDHGTINPNVDSTTTATWGATLGNKTYVWRSAVGIRQDGSLVFVAGASLSVRTLANIVHDAGAVRAMELDINPEWTNFITYTHPSPGEAVPHMLTKDEQANPYRYLQLSSRDFVAVLAR